MASGSRFGRWLNMSDDDPPDYDEIASPPSYSEAIKGQSKKIKYRIESR